MFGQRFPLRLWGKMAIQSDIRIMIPLETAGRQSSQLLEFLFLGIHELPCVRLVTMERQIHCYKPSPL
jgi:hypothetical protein